MLILFLFLRDCGPQILLPCETVERHGGGFLQRCQLQYPISALQREASIKKIIWFTTTLKTASSFSCSKVKVTPPNNVYLKAFERRFKTIFSHILTSIYASFDKGAHATTTRDWNYNYIRCKTQPKGSTIVEICLLKGRSEHWRYVSRAIWKINSCEVSWCYSMSSRLWKQETLKEVRNQLLFLLRFSWSPTDCWRAFPAYYEAVNFFPSFNNWKRQTWEHSYESSVTCLFGDKQLGQTEDLLMVLWWESEEFEVHAICSRRIESICREIPRVIWFEHNGC